LSSDHGEGLALGRVDLSGHDGRSRFVLGEREFSETATRPGTEVTDIVGNLVERTSDNVHSTGSLDNRIVSGESFELVGSSLEGETSNLGDFGSDLDIESLSGVESSSDSGSSLSELRETRENVLDSFDAVRDLLNVTGELLSESKRSSVLQVSSSNLDDVIESLLLLEESGMELLKSRDERVGDLDDSRDMHGSREARKGEAESILERAWCSDLRALTYRWKIETC
jgi:hypothetical protein